MLTDRAPNTKCLKEYTEDDLCCSDGCHRGCFFFQDHVGGGHYYYQVSMSQPGIHKEIYNCPRKTRWIRSKNRTIHPADGFSTYTIDYIRSKAKNIPQAIVEMNLFIVNGRTNVNLFMFHLNIKL